MSMIVVCKGPSPEPGTGLGVHGDASQEVTLSSERSRGSWTSAAIHVWRIAVTVGGTCGINGEQWAGRGVNSGFGGLTCLFECSEGTFRTEANEVIFSLWSTSMR
jgi:hypothetical protein